nr:hypothetical protein [Pandoravirus massiliensis]
MGQAQSATHRGYDALAQDDLLDSFGMTSQEYRTRAHRAIDTVRALPDEYATAEDRAAAIAAVYTGRCAPLSFLALLSSTAFFFSRPCCAVLLSP